MEWLLCFSVAFSLLFLIGIITNTRSSSTRRLPPGPTPLPIVGNLLLLGREPHRSLIVLAKAHGPIMTLKLGSVTTVVVSTPSAAKEALSINDKALASHAIPDAVRIPDYLPTSMIWAAADERWKSLRKLCSNQLFTPHSLDAAQDVRRQKVQELVSHLRGRARREAVDIGRVAFATTINLISNTFFSVDLVDIGTESVQEFRDLVWAVMEEIGKPNVSDFFPLLRALDLQGRRRRVAQQYDKFILVLDEMVDSRLRAMAQGSTTPIDFLDALLRLQDQNDDFTLDRATIRSLLTDVFFAGSDTSSNTVEWAMAELLANPDAMAKARTELAEVIRSPGGEVAEPDIARLPYLQAVVKETLRQHPPAPLLLPHEADSDVELGGYVVPKGTRVLVNAWAIGRREEAWEQPDSFVPERFMGGSKAVDFRGRDMELIPYGSGRRMCPGLPLALRMVHLMLATLLHSFEWTLPEGMGPGDVDLAEKFGLTLALATPLRAVATTQY